MLNDRPDLARELGCDGAYRENVIIAQTRALVGDKAIIGVTRTPRVTSPCSPAMLVPIMWRLGRFSHYPTWLRDPPDILTWWQESWSRLAWRLAASRLMILPTLAAAGADFLAVSGGVWQHPEVGCRRARLTSFDAYR